MAVGALLGAMLVFAPAASAADTGAIAKSAGQKWVLKSEANGKYVSSEIKDGDDQWAKLRARADTPGAWERFTLHTDDKAETVSLRYEASGYFASAEVQDSDTHKGMLRARGAKTGNWERFSLISQGSGKYALKSQANGLYVSAEINDSGGDNGLLRARSTTIGSWERFTLEKATIAGTGGTELGKALPPLAPSTASRRTTQVMSWNLCGNNNNGCANYLTGKDALTADLKSRLARHGTLPDVIFFQEICEKHAKPIELLLEGMQPKRGWDVRFAPINYNVQGASGMKAQKQCTDAGGYDRGAYGVAVAVPDENTWYQAYDLKSPAEAVNKNGQKYKVEQRTAICATVPSHAAMYCSAHFSTGGQNWDDPARTFQRQQAAQLIEAADQRGYRPIFGGDLNVTPPARGFNVLKPMYDRYQECDENSPIAPGDGRDTMSGAKIDYIFGPGNSTSSCSIENYTGRSDHYSIHSVISLPAY
ncbi:endonuclease/exonuclease/phosphatase family protein [Streptomyces sp. NPDC021093]|uniref:endonuclease/exonuclease/phosphatase family protein n=1 Tax=Streptomyces sp. NPDC021093 TaxID=3365112 RepID=UPI0037B9883E